MTLDEQIDEALISLANSVKALSIANQQLHATAEKMRLISSKAKKPELKVVDNSVLGDALAKGLKEQSDE